MAKPQNRKEIGHLMRAVFRFGSLFCPHILFLWNLPPMLRENCLFPIVDTSFYTG